MSEALKPAQFQKKILDWYNQNKRILPWRDSNNPYFIWVSEIILQQTRIVQGLPYYQRFVEAFPTVSDLARANEQQVLRLWQGLGYYSRARNMHRCAKKIVSEHNGAFPTNYSQLLSLPGIGPYTAAAISSIAFNEKEAVVDGNVFRVLSRIFGINTDIAGTEGKKIFTAKANELISEKQPGDFNQAMMEFGATHCTPQNPNCSECPFSKACVALATDRIAELPVKTKKLKVRVRYLDYFIIIYRGKMALRQRTGKDIWKGLFDFYLVESKKPTNTEKIYIADQLLAGCSELKDQPQKIIKHILTHQDLRIRFIKMEARKKPDLGKEFKFYNAREAHALPKPIVISRFLEKNEF